MGILIEELWDMEKTVASELFAGKRYPWEVLGEIGAFVVKLGETLEKKGYEQILPQVWAAKSAVIAPTACIMGPCIIDEEAEIRHCAFIRGNVIVGKGAVVGNSTELKNAVLFDSVQVPHYNYAGDSVLGYKSHMGAGSIASNLKSDKSVIRVRDGEHVYETGRTKIGVLLGDEAEVGCGSVLNPGTIVGKHATVYPLSCVRGVVPENSIYKKQGEIVEKRA